MVKVSILNEMQRDYRGSFRSLVEHLPGQYVLYLGSVENKTFHPNRASLDEALKKYSGVYGVNFYFERIPKHLPRTMRYPKAGLLNILREQFGEEKVMADARDGGL